MATFASPHFDQASTYWQSIAGDAAPCVSQFDFLEIPSVLPDITLWEMQDKNRIICRMVGTLVVSRMKSDITGTELTKTMPPDIGLKIVDDLRAIQDQPCGVMHTIINRHVTGKIVRMESLTLPLAADRGGLPKFVCVNHMIETVGYNNLGDASQVEIASSLEDREFIDLGWGIPGVENLDQKTT